MSSPEPIPARPATLLRRGFSFPDGGFSLPAGNSLLPAGRSIFGPIELDEREAVGAASNSGPLTAAVGAVTSTVTSAAPGLNMKQASPPPPLSPPSASTRLKKAEAAAPPPAPIKPPRLGPKAAVKPE